MLSRAINHRKLLKIARKLLDFFFFFFFFFISGNKLHMSIKEDKFNANDWNPT